MGQRRLLARSRVKQRDDHDGPRPIATQKKLDHALVKSIDDKGSDEHEQGRASRINATAEC